MQKLRHSTVQATIPAPVSTGSYGYAKQDGSTVLTPDSWNMVQEELTRLVTDADGGNTALSDTATDQVKKAVLAMIKTAANGLISDARQFIPVSGNSQPVLVNRTQVAGSSTFTGGTLQPAFTTSAGSGKVAQAVQTINLTSFGTVPTGTTHVKVRCWFNSNSSNNVTTDLMVRKNAAEANWTTNEVYGRRAMLDPVEALGGAFETEQSVTFDVEIDTATKTFDYYVLMNRLNLTTTGTSLVLVYMWLEGYYAQRSIA